MMDPPGGQPLSYLARMNRIFRNTEVRFPPNLLHSLQLSMQPPAHAFLLLPSRNGGLCPRMFINGSMSSRCPLFFSYQAILCR
ncbi:uncharacterized protein BDCG_16233 [Blastomyces dermatitidis ER-3]|nr:uncharacterized protein BDCG_16233 [Blastomyces dermatitidis ER-3]OAS99631.1 hypothetical protein BDCG_16233 [Blastomyces dermatitidis ER-3]